MIKLKYYFTEGDPKIFTIQEIERGEVVSHMLDHNTGAIQLRRRFTGLLDVHGEEIYEGDTVKFIDGSVRPYTVVWEQNKYASGWKLRSFSGSLIDVGTSATYLEIVNYTLEELKEIVK